MGLIGHRCAWRTMWLGSLAAYSFHEQGRSNGPFRVSCWQAHIKTDRLLQSLFSPPFFSPSPRPRLPSRLHRSFSNNDNLQPTFFYFILFSFFFSNDLGQTLVSRRTSTQPSRSPNFWRCSSPGSPTPNR
ncbi:hypothetical protein IE53DRAFT_16793 [Violaceomyces palustris]|uniref:Uncharacterized protein n=1 Tax=Violaceomyces palustris TaxID=1673888 RepID=A0ACD0NLG4_9BASI|nr:hypothetical protein IE53DRAFT_16793 [Violaceomyces palustris]